jgi:hypothetical protein
MTRQGFGVGPIRLRAAQTHNLKLELLTPVSEATDAD